MAVQTGVLTTFAFKEEATFGVPPGTTGAQYLRRVSCNLSTNKDTFASNEVRSDQQISDVRHGQKSARGTLEGEISCVTYDAFWAALLRGTWVTGVSAAPADFATGVTIANGTEASQKTSNITFAGAGDLIAKGFKVGDIVRFTGLNTAANNATNLRIVRLTATVMEVFPRITAQAQQATGWSVATAGRKLAMGNTQRSFTFERAMDEALTYETFSGVRVGGANINVQPNGLATVSFDLMGLGGTPGGSPYFSSPAAETVTPILSGVDGRVRLAGLERGIVTGVQINMTNNLSMPPVIGTTTAPQIFYGRMGCTGTVSVYVDSVDVINAFINEIETDLVVQLEANETVSKSFLTFNMQRIKFTGAQVQAGPDGGVIAQMPFQALYRTGGSGTVYDAGTLSMQRSNT